MDLMLNGKVAIITGASRGIGRAIAGVLASEGMRLVLVSRSQDQLEDLDTSLNTDCLVCAVDLRDPGAAPSVVRAAIGQFGQIDLLVNNAGATVRGDFLSLKDTEWEDGFALKFYGAMRLCREAWPYLCTSQGGIVNIVGVGGRTGSAEFTIGGAVNAAILNLTKSLADRGVRDGVRVNAINPGSINTDRLQGRIKAYAAAQNLDAGQAAKKLAEAQGVTRFGNPLEIARTVAFLASPGADYIQGAILDVDGGQTRTL